MNSATERFVIAGPAGDLELALDRPTPGAPVTGLGLIAHPHPLYGGTLDNKVAQTLARAFVGFGLITVRPNFRGVGKSAGEHDHGQGETEDLWRAWQWLIEKFPDTDGLRCLGGFSFGAVMATHVAHDWATHRVSHRGPGLHRNILVGLGIAPERRQPAMLTPCARLIHGELDEVVPLQAVLDWARPQKHPVLVLPGAEHFFHARLPDLKDCIMRCLAG